MMAMGQLFVVLCISWMVLIPLISGAAVDGSDHHPQSTRVHHEQKLSEHRHRDEDGEHNADYDHDAFLGGEAEEFDNLSPEESKARLVIIVEKIDKDGDSFVTKDELKDWIRFTQERYINKDVDRQWTQHNPDGKNTINWDTYRGLIYAFLDESHVGEEEEETVKSYRQMEARDRRRWDIADEDKSGDLTIAEFKHFLHPEEAPHMRDIIVLETVEDIDKDGDGKISMEEYIGDLYRDEGGSDTEPEWVSSEREQFKSHRDANRDGFMDASEVEQWIVPVDFDNAEAEARHLIYESDADKDEKLTKGEILEKYDLFVGSQATDFGEALSRHDEF